MKKISRTLKATKAVVGKIEVSEDGALDTINYTVYVDGVAKDKEIIKEAKAQYGKDNTYVVISKECKEVKYSCSINTFIDACNAEKAANIDGQTVIDC